MKFIFKDKNRELVLPITPPSFTVGKGMRIETINIHTVGDVNLAGNETLGVISIDCLFPKSSYPFAYSSDEPYELVDRFVKWIKDKEIVRFVISDTPINIPVLVENIDYSERDGTRDIYATLALREYRELNVVKVETIPTQNKSRPASNPPVTVKTYKIVSGDTLSAICRKFYGNASLYSKLAKYNNIKNPHLIYTGNTLKIPDIGQL